MTDIKLKSPIPIGATKHVDVDWWNNTHQSEESGKDEDSSISSEHSSSFDSLILKAGARRIFEGQVEVRERRSSGDNDELQTDKLVDSIKLISLKPDDKSLFSVADDQEDSVDDGIPIYDTLVGGLDEAMSTLSDVLQSSADVRQEFKVQWETTLSSYKIDIEKIDEEIENAILLDQTRYNMMISDEGAAYERHVQQARMDDVENHQLLQIVETNDKGGWFSSVSNLLTALQQLREEEACLIKQQSIDQPFTFTQDQCAIRRD